MRLDDIFNHINTGILLVDKELCIHYANQWVKIFHDGALLEGEKLDDVFNLTDQELHKLQRKIKTVLSLKSPSFISVEHDHYLLPMKNTKLLNQKFKMMQQEVSLIPYGDDKSLVLIVIYDQTALMISREEIIEKSQVLASSLDDLQKAHSKLQEQTAIIEYKTNYDALTGLPNRTLFKDRAINAMNQAAVNNERLVLISVNLDRFRLVNDTYGASLGDELLIDVSHALKEFIDPTDSIARLGADEFLILKTKFNELDQVANFVEELLERVAQPWILKQQEIYVTASVGISVYPDDSNDYDQLSVFADMAMEQAKQDRQTGYHFFTARLDDELRDILILESELKKAVSNEELEVFYQPKFKVVDGVAHHHGAEALIRWTHPTMGRIFPDNFIPISEHIGLITDITFFVLKETLKLQRTLLKQGIEQVVSINISPQDLHLDNFCMIVVEMVESYGIPTRLIELEVTERTAIKEENSSYKVLHCLREKGFLIALDDFGTGFSSLSYLARMPIDILKIDKSFVDQYSLSDKHKKFLQQIVELARVFDMETIAEGVEDLEVVKKLVEFQCHHFQGYYFSKPLPKTQFLKFTELNKNGFKLP